MLPLWAQALPQEVGESTEGKEVMAAEAFQVGQALYENGKFLEAARQFEKAHRLAPHPSILANIGYCYDKIGDYPKAVNAFREYLANPDQKETKRNEKIGQYVEHMKAKLGDLRVTCLSARCEVAVDGSSYGMTPATILLRAGAHVVEVTPIDGGKMRQYTVNVPGGGQLVLDVDLADSATVQGAKTEVSQDGSLPRNTVSEPGLRASLWIATGTVIAGACTTAALIGVGYRTREDFFDGGQKDKELKQRGESLVVGIDVAATVTAAAALTAVVLGIVDLKRKRNSRGERSQSAFRAGNLPLTFSPGVFSSLRMDF
jgi:tetratricopeptide (TPR) repeat protein